VHGFKVSVCNLELLQSSILNVWGQYIFVRTRDGEVTVDIRVWTEVQTLSVQPAILFVFVFTSVQHLIISLSPPNGVRTIDSEHMSVKLIAAYLRLSRRNNWHQITSYLRASGCCHSDALHACLPLIHCVYVCPCVFIEIKAELSDPHVKSETPISLCTDRKQREIGFK